MSPLIGKRIECHLETAEGSRTPFIADVRKGRSEGEVHLTPIGSAPVPSGYCPTSLLYVRGFVEVERAEGAAAEAAPVLPSGFVPEVAAEPSVNPEEDHEARKLSQNPTKFHSARNAKSKGAVDHGSAAATPDEFAEK